MGFTSKRALVPGVLAEPLPLPLVLPLPLPFPLPPPLPLPLPPLTVIGAAPMDTPLLVPGAFFVLTGGPLHVLML